MTTSVQGSPETELHTLSPPSPLRVSLNRPTLMDRIRNFVSEVPLGKNARRTFLCECDKKEKKGKHFDVVKSSYKIVISIKGSEDTITEPEGFIAYEIDDSEYISGNVSIGTLPPLPSLILPPFQYRVRNDRHPERTVSITLPPFQVTLQCVVDPFCNRQKIENDIITILQRKLIELEGKSKSSGLFLEKKISAQSSPPVKSSVPLPTLLTGDKSRPSRHRILYIGAGLTVLVASLLLVNAHK